MEMQSCFPFHEKFRKKRDQAEPRRPVHSSTLLALAEVAWNTNYLSRNIEMQSCFPFLQKSRKKTNQAEPRRPVHSSTLLALAEIETCRCNVSFLQNFRKKTDRAGLFYFASLSIGRLESSLNE